MENETRMEKMRDPYPSTDTDIDTVLKIIELLDGKSISAASNTLEKAMYVIRMSTIVSGMPENNPSVEILIANGIVFERKEKWRAEKKLSSASRKVPTSSVIPGAKPLFCESRTRD